MILKALTLGFSTGIFCMAYCYPILGPIMLSNKDRDIRISAISLGLFLSGRLIAYILFGLLLGLLGKYITILPLFQKIILPALYLVLGCMMIFYGIVQSFTHLKFCSIFSKFFKNPKYLFIVGFFAGINICPPFLLAMSFAISLGGILKSILFFIFFFIATSIFILPFIFSGFISRFKEVRIAARITAVIVGLWFVYLGIKNLIT